MLKLEKSVFPNGTLGFWFFFPISVTVYCKNNKNAYTNSSWKVFSNKPKSYNVENFWGREAFNDVEGKNEAKEGN